MRHVAPGGGSYVASLGNFLENRPIWSRVLRKENLLKSRIRFYKSFNNHFHVWLVQLL